MAYDKCYVIGLRHNSASGLSVLNSAPYLVYYYNAMQTFLHVLGPVMDSLHWPAFLCEGDGGSHSKGPEPCCPRVVWSCSTGWIPSGIIHYVSSGQHLSSV